jgi:hypothetical protein
MFDIIAVVQPLDELDEEIFVVGAEDRGIGLARQVFISPWRSGHGKDI